MKQEFNWHNIDATEVARILNVSIETGLSSPEVEEKTLKYGKNVLTKKKRQSAFARFLLQFHQPLIYILLAATVVTFFLDEIVDSAVIFGVVLINAIIGYIQETKALKAIDALEGSLAQKAAVIRNGKKQIIESVEIVPGDVVLLRSGDKFPADIRLFELQDMQVDESALTGESVPVQKHIDPVPAENVLGDRFCMGFSSTNVTYGQGRGIVVATGDYTEVGKIQQSIAGAQDLETPLTEKIKKFSHLLLKVIIGLSFILIVIGLIRGESFGEIFMVAVALAVGAIPEGLPVAVTIMLALGVSKMAKRKAIIRKLVAVETLGSTNVICSDKTGTLTENQMTVQKIFAGGYFFNVTGLGYNPEGTVELNGLPADLQLFKSLSLCLQAGILCNDSGLREKNGAWMIEGEPTEGALLVSGYKGGFKLEELECDMPRISSIPFESEYQYMATLHGGVQQIIFMKGASEAILERCNWMYDENGDLTALNKTQILSEVEELASQGLRVLGFAMKYPATELERVNHEDTGLEMIFLGIQGMIDPPRKEAIEAVALCQKAGIDVKMITGDHAITAASIAEQIGLQGLRENGKLKALNGKELQLLDNGDFGDAAESVAVFARVSPDQKLRLVKALQERGKIVAMTGDGVNDGPALKQANIGVAMGITGTDVAKDASDMVLTDDNFSSIEGAVEEGRGVFDNLTKFIVWTLPTNLGEGLVILAAVVVGSQLPILPVQLLWINMTTAILLGLMLAFEPKEPGIMDRPPRPAKQPILTTDLIMRTLLVGTLMMFAAFGLYSYEVDFANQSVSYGQTVATSVFIFMEAAYLFNCRSVVRPLNEIGFFTNRWVFFGIGAMTFFQLIYIYTSVMNTLFNSSPLQMDSWWRIIGVSVALFVIVTIEKRIRFNLSKPTNK
ncbi:Ca2+-transporting ATPase [Aquiflexum balticum DSM 16537]|uniref:Ca2+-transporting ATPase n=1 Tax=Aquiflexum balticum DSM 16537 TaxID=758820 RepID=A0A1W2H4R5_9BACT|nr:cation-transporting P-type ATPase [Aquiflexum balticum]SMD43901.1 Ca2+-transporting ATPase [Aquiflexum balticum DSM 16537]